MTNTAVPSPPQPDAGTARRRCPDDLWVLGELAVARARRWTDESASEPVPRSAKLLSRILADPDGLTFTTRFVDDVVRPTDLDVASDALKRLSSGRTDFLPPALAGAMGLGSTARSSATSSSTPPTRASARRWPACARAGTASTSTSWARPSWGRRRPPAAWPRSPAS